ncbi:MAG: prepilin-type N-terminal cleavage/methylation domain-containing protein, partial [Desulfobacter sp.]|nr:prepilin-type N-terminal cleavage/methylation domain-containing protein [Desulfobacter sp.]
MKSKIKNINKIQNSKGFTLIELLITVAISSIVLLMVTQVFMSTNKMNTIQENVASVQQDIRAAMDIMSTDIMMAGLDPSGSAANAGFADNGSDTDDTDSNSIALKYDHDGDG